MFRIFFIPILTFSLFITTVSAQPELDQSFGTNGKREVNFSAIISIQDLIIQPDSKMIFTSSCSHFIYSSGQFCVVRRNEDGSPDLTFNPAQNGGFNLLYVSGFSGASNSLMLQSDGKIIAAGYANFNNLERPVLVRYNTNGTLDTTYGTNGIVSTDVIPSQNSRIHGAALQKDEKVVVVGNYGISQQFAARYNTDGTLDNTFGNNGLVFTTIPNSASSSYSVAIQQDGKIIMGGIVWQSNPTAISNLIVRLNTDGSLDTSWDEDGIKMIVSGTSTLYNGIVSTAVQTDGKILALGGTNVIYRLNSDGSLDTSFDGDGSQQALEAPATIFKINVTPSGKITAIGHTDISGSSGIRSYYKIGKFLSDGSPQPGFGTNGYLTVDTTGRFNDGATAIAYNPQGKIVIAGKSTDGTVNIPWENPLPSMIRLNAPLIQNVAFSGKIVRANGKPVLNGFVTLRSGSEIIAGGRTNNFGYFRFNNITTAQTYTLSTRAKGMSFVDRIVLVDDTISNFLVVAD